MNSTRTFAARYLITLDTAVLSAHNHEITVTGYGSSIQFTLDGQPATYERVEAIRKLALNLGTFERISGPSLTPPIGNALAHRLHIDLGRLHIGGGHALASEVLGKRVTSLAALTLDEARELWSYAHACAELPTQPSILFAGVA